MIEFPDHLSYSAIDLFLTCPLKYKFKYIDKKPEVVGPAAVLGKAFHTVMETNFKYRLETKIDKPIVQLLELFEHEFEEGVKLPRFDPTDENPNKITINWRFDNKNKMLESGLALVRRYYRDQVPFLEPALVEQEYNYPLNGKYIKYLVGYIDLVTTSGLVIDYKTVNFPWKTDKIHQHMQPTFYSLLMDSPSQFEFHFIVKNSTREAGITVARTERSQRDIDWLKKQLDGYVQLIETCLESGIMPAAPGDACTYCDFRRPCGYRT